MYTENQLYLVGGTNSCSCNVHLNLSFKKRWDFNKRGQKSHTQKNKCSPSYIPKFQNSKFKMLSSLFITWCPDGRICNSGEPLLKLASPEFGKHFKFDTLCIFCVKTLIKVYLYLHHTTSLIL